MCSGLGLGLVHVVPRVSVIEVPLYQPPSLYKNSIATVFVAHWWPSFMDRLHCSIANKHNNYISNFTMVLYMRIHGNLFYTGKLWCSSDDSTMYMYVPVLQYLGDSPYTQYIHTRYTHTHIHTHTHAHTCSCGCVGYWLSLAYALNKININGVCVCVCVCMHVHVHEWMHTCMSMCMCMCMCMREYTHTHANFLDLYFYQHFAF